MFRENGGKKACKGQDDKTPEEMNKLQKQ
jgi:hypothetical protein